MPLSPWSCSSLSLTHTGAELFSFAYWKTKGIKVTERARKTAPEDAELLQVGAQATDPQIRSGTRAITLLAQRSLLISSKAAVATCEHSSRLDLLAFPHRSRGRRKSSDPHQSLRHSIPSALPYQLYPVLPQMHMDLGYLYTQNVYRSNWRGYSSMQLWGRSHCFGNIAVFGSSTLL